MSEGSTASSGSGPDFHLPDEILSVVPTDPYDQLDLARKITSMAIASPVSKLESEVRMLRQRIYEKDRFVLELEEKVTQLEQVYHEADMQLKITRDDNMKLLRERDSLVLTAKKLGRDLAKLEAFKRHLMQSLNDDNLSKVETVDIMTCNQPISKPSKTKDVEMNGHMASHSLGGSTECGYRTDDASSQAVQKIFMMPQVTPKLTSAGSPQIISVTGSPVNYSSTALASPGKTSGTTSPFKAQHEGLGTFSSWYPSSQRSSTANSPSRGQSVSACSPRVDGKEFFRQARNRLKYEQFSAFLANIKEFNAQKQSREETLKKAEEIFGLDNEDLYLSFQGLLNRNLRKNVR